MAEVALAQAQVPVELRATPALVHDLELLVDLEARLRKLREREAEVEYERERQREKLARRIEPGWWTVGEFTVRRTQVAPRPSVDAWKAIDEGTITEEVLRPYMVERRPFERWSVKRRRRRRVSA